MSKRKQHTFKQKSSFSGIGVHTGKEVSLSFCPAEENQGILFKRVDLPEAPCIQASLHSVCDTRRSTSIGSNGIQIQTVEHVLAALKGFSIDNAIIEISGIEPPIGDGSALPFVEMVEKSQVVEQQAELPIVFLKEPLYFSDNEIHLVALPSETLRISYTLHYPGCKVLNGQFHSFSLTREGFKREIAPCRTFSRYEEIEFLVDSGLIKGGSLDNSMVIKDGSVLSKGGLRFPDEMARHKILDLIGDLSLIGIDFSAHIIAIRSGHETNHLFARKIFEKLT